jgi:hypothetical protein
VAKGTPVYIPLQQRLGRVPVRARRQGAVGTGLASARLRRRLAVELCFALAWTVTLRSGELYGQNTISAEYRSKANFLVKFLDFVDWPEDAFPSAHSPFRLCVRGEFPFGTSLAEAARGALPHGRHVEVRWLHDDHMVQSCHILFVSGSESKRYAKVFQAVAGSEVLTIGETPEFLSTGGAMSFSVQAEDTERGGVRFEVNLPAVARAHLTVSSRLLAVAKRVVNSQEARKG